MNISNRQFNDMSDLLKAVREHGRAASKGRDSIFNLARDLTVAASEGVIDTMFRLPDDQKNAEAREQHDKRHAKSRKIDGVQTVDDTAVLYDEWLHANKSEMHNYNSVGVQVSKLRNFVHLGGKKGGEGVELIDRITTRARELKKANEGNKEFKLANVYNLLVDQAKAVGKDGKAIPTDEQIDEMLRGGNNSSKSAVEKLYDAFRTIDALLNSDKETADLLGDGEVMDGDPEGEHTNARDVVQQANEMIKDALIRGYQFEKLVKAEQSAEDEAETNEAIASLAAKLGIDPSKLLKSVSKARK